ncbi:guanylate-binding protein 1-like isoform X2 [Scleropages formosus]|uniref:guanylate-binding protein 1-like isoform X2 n=1 Tax=Scleropages formosus TaxID=113540 RepID=UPI0010FAA859|nr:guanylate-binding protein 1-like isoform X2 [Scleropages formosus]
MESPVCLIENIDGTLRVVQEATEYLMRINQPVVVVAVVGLYRTGKSYLMNKLAGKRKGFALGATVQSKTKGIWMWCVPHPVKEGHTLVLLDTEGLGDVEKGDQKNDAWIFSLAILLSSTLVYNSRGTIDNQAVENLQYVTELTERIKVKAPSASSAEDDDAEDAQFVQFFPSFVWAVRDFTLLLEIDGRQVNEDQYLEHALTLKKGRDRRTVDYNLPRECIRNYFPTRKCFIFETPAPPEKMAHLESMTESELSPSFQAVAFDFCNYIFKESSVKKVKGGLPVTGRMLSHLAKTYVETIASGGVPCLENAVLTMAQIENQAAVEEGLQVYQRGMQGLTFPVSMEEMSNEHRNWDSQATKTFMSRSFKDDSGEYLKTLADAINKEYASFLLKNEDMSEKVCRQLLSELSEDMANKLKNGFYAKPGGYELYCSDHDNLVAEYRKRPKKGVKAEEVLENFLKEKSVESNSVLQADKNISEKERKIHEEKVKAAMLEQEKKAEEQKRLELERTLQDERRSQEEKLQMMREKMEEDLKSQRKEAERAVECKLKEQRDLLEKGFKDKAEMMSQEIENLKAERPKEDKSGNFFTNHLFPLIGHGLQALSTVYQYKALKKGLGF